MEKWAESLLGGSSDEEERIGCRRKKSQREHCQQLSALGNWHFSPWSPLRISVQCALESPLQITGIWTKFLSRSILINYKTGSEGINFPHFQAVLTHRLRRILLLRRHSWSRNVKNALICAWKGTKSVSPVAILRTQGIKKGVERDSTELEYHFFIMRSLW